MKLTTKCNLLFASFYLMMYPSLILFSSYMMLRGSNSEQIALYLSVLGITSMISKPIYAVLVDQGKCKSLTLILCACIVVGATIFFYSPQLTITQALIYIIFTSMNTAGIMEIIDSWVLKLSVEYPELDYAKHRSCGSLSYAFVSIIFGYLLSKLGLKFAPIGIYFLVGLFACVVLTIPNIPATTQKKEKVSYSDIKQLLTNRQFVIFVIFFAFGCAMVDLADNYIGVLVLEKGGTTAHTGLYEFIKAGLEFFVMYGCTKLLTKYGTKKVLVLSYFGVFLKNVAAALMPSAMAIVATSITQIIGFPLLIPAKMEMLKRLVDSKSLALAMSLSAVVTALFVSLVCNPLISLWVPYIQTSGAFACVSIFGLLAAIGTWILQKNVE